MSYGVIASKSAHLLVESTFGAGGSEGDAALDRFQTVWGATWVPGRVTLTGLHLTFIPNRASRGAAILNLNLRDLGGVEIGGGRMNKAIGLRTPTHTVQVRCMGAPALAQQVADAIEKAKRTPRRI